VVTARYAPFLGGIETHVGETVRRMAERDLDVTVLTTDPRGDMPAQEHDGVDVRRFRAWAARADVYASPALVRELTAGGYDLVHVQGVHTALPPMVLAAAQRAGIPNLLTFHTGGHSNRLRGVLRRPQWRALRPLLRRADALVAVCEYEVAHFSRSMGVDPGHIRLVPNGAEPLPVSGSVLAVPGSPLIVSVGRLERYKGHHRLIAALPALLEAAPAARLVIVGRGPYERHLRRQAARLGVGESVTFLSFDHDSRAGLGALVASADAVALLSDYEAHPVAVIEALALGRKVVVADTSGLTELARHDLVTAVPVDAGPGEIARVVAAVAAAPCGAAPSLPTWEDCVDDLVDLYGELLARHRPRASHTTASQVTSAPAPSAGQL